MGLLEDLLGGALGGAQQGNAPAQQGQGGMSPVMLALMALMAYRAMSGNSAPQQQRGAPGAGPHRTIRSVICLAASSAARWAARGGGGTGGGGMGGGLGDILGQVLAGGAQGGAARRVPQSGGGSMGGGGIGDILGSILAGGASGRRTWQRYQRRARRHPQAVAGKRSG